MPGATGGLIGGLAEMPGRGKGNQLTDQLLAASEEELNAMSGAVVYGVDDLDSITCKRLVMGTNPDFVVLTRNGQRQKYGLANPLDYDAVVEALRGLYGNRVM